MPYTVACSSCDAELRIPDNAIGRTFKCPKCGKPVTMDVAAAPRVEPPISVLVP